MLFDLEDYTNARIIGTNSLPADQLNWVGPYTTARATRDAYLKSVNEYVLAAGACSSAAEKKALESKYFEFLDALRVYGPAFKQFWNAMVSLPVKASGQFADGDGFYVTEEGYWFSDVNYNWPSGTEHLISYPRFYSNQWNQNNRNYAFAATHGDSFLQSIVDQGGAYLYTYTSLTQEVYDEYESAMKALQLKAKEIMLMGEGRTSFEEYVTPEIPAWDGYPELSGYVRGTNSVAIAGATVRLVDAAGQVWEKVTDEKGYYKFEKEFFYTSCDLGTASTVDIFLKPTIGSASLYDTDSIFQSSFFGAENNRSFTWPVSIKMGKPARRNIKIEFLPDYSSYPSFSGYVKDAAGNPIKDAYVQIKDGWSGFCIGQYMKPNGDIAMNFKYNDFGVDRTVLTDENGFYEYTSQMVGEWFNKQLMRIGDTPGKLGGRTFDEYFVNPIDINFTEYTTGRNLLSNETFFPLLIPYKQDANDSSIKWEGVHIYDEQDYYTSRFKYALNQYNDFQYQRIDLNAHYDIDVDVAVAANYEFRADKFTVELLAERKNLESGLSSQTYVYTTSGYFKVVYPATGESYVGNSGWYYSHWHLDINYSNADDYKDFYIYSCDSQGRAMGYIKEINAPAFVKAIDLSCLGYLRTLNTINLYGESIDFSGQKYLESVNINHSDSLKSVIGLESKRLTNLELYRLHNLESIDVSELTGLYILTLKYLPALQSLDIHSNTNLEYLQITNTDIALDVTGLKRLSNVRFDKLTMTSDDVDDLLNQLASMAPNQFGENVSYGYVNINRISRSSYSDEAYATLMQRNWNISLGEYFYDEEIIPNKLIIEFDPSLASSGQWIDMYQPSIQTTTGGYWIGRSWTGELFGNIGSYGDFYVNNNNISSAIEFGTTDARVEIFSCNQYGVPAGEITHVSLSHPKIKFVDTSELSELEHFDIYYNPSSGSPYSTIESLDFTQNQNLKLVNISGSKIESIDLTGLISLENLTLSYCPNLGQITGFSSLSSLKHFGIERMPSLGYHSLAGLEDINNVYINEADLYDSTHVDTMLAELRTSVETAVASIDSQLYIKQEELAANQADWNLLMADLQSLYGELNQLVSDGAPQSSIDAKQSEIDAKEILNNSFYEQSQIIGAAISSLGTDRESHFGGTFNTNYMARTSASDADYASLLEEYSWNLNIGSEFIAPYTAPVKGFVTYDWTYEQNSNSYFYFDGMLRFSSTTGYVKYVSGIYSGIIQVGSDIYNPLTISGNIAKGGLEFWSCDSHGRPSGNITAFSHTNGYGQWLKSFDISNLTEIKNLDLFVWQAAITSIDLSSNTNIERLYIVYFSNLESIVGFQGLVNLKEVSISEAKKLDLPVDFTPLTNLQSMTLWDLGVGKNSRLDISGLDKLQYFQAKWTYLLSEDLDSVLMALDAAGLNSESDFAYEGHLDSVGSSLYLNFGMGIGRHAIADAAYASLQSKGWNLNTGDQIIDSIEDPVKGIARWGASTSWAALAFTYIGGRSVMVKYPDGRIENVGSMISYSFDSSTPVEDKFIEFWEVDDYGRPRHGGITHINEWWNTGVTSLEVNNLTGLENIYMPQFMGSHLDFSGMPKLHILELNNSQTLQNLILDGCVRLRNVIVDNCPEIDLDQVIQSLGTNDFEINFGYYTLHSPYRQRTHASDVAADYLRNRGWNLNVIEPAGDTVLFNVTAGQNVNLYLSSSGGYSKITFPAGSSWASDYPEGYFIWGKYTAKGYYEQGQFSFTPNFTGQISIKGAAQTQQGWIDSGEIRLIDNRGGQGSFVFSTLSKVKVILVNEVNSFNWFNQNKAAIANLELERLMFQYLPESVTSLNLSTFNAKELIVQYAPALSQLIIGNQATDLNLYEIPNLTSLNLTENIVGLGIGSTGIQTISTNNVINTWPSALRNLGLDHCPISEISNLPATLKSIALEYLDNLTSLELQSWPGIDRVFIDTCPSVAPFAADFSMSNTSFLRLKDTNVSSIDVTGATLSSVYFTNLNTGSDSPALIGLETVSGFYWTNLEIRGWKNPDFVIPSNINIYLYPRFDSETISVTYVGEYTENTTAYISGSGANFQSLTSPIKLPKANHLYLSEFANTSIDVDFSEVSNRTNLYLLSLSNITTIDLSSLPGVRNPNDYGYSLNSIVIENLFSLTSLTIPSNSNIYIFTLNNMSSLRTLDFNGSQLYFFYSSNSSNLTVTGLRSYNLTMWNGNNIDLSGTICYNYGFNGMQGTLTLNNVSGASMYMHDNWQISTVNLQNSIFTGDVSIYNCPNLTTINAAGARINAFHAKSLANLTSVTLSLKGSYGVYMNRNNNLNSVTFTDANLSTQLYVVDIYYCRLFNAAIVDSIINAVSQTNRTGGVMVLSNMSQRTSASAAAYSKLGSQGWNLVNNVPI